MELKWAIIEGLVPDIEVQDSIVCHKIGLIYDSHSRVYARVRAHACAHTHTQTHRKHSTFYTSTFTVYYKVYALLKALYHLLERRIRLSATC